MENWILDEVELQNGEGYCDGRCVDGVYFVIKGVDSAKTEGITFRFFVKPADYLKIRKMFIDAEQVA